MKVQFLSTKYSSEGSLAWVFKRGWNSWISVLHWLVLLSVNLYHLLLDYRGKWKDVLFARFFKWDVHYMFVNYEKILNFYLLFSSGNSFSTLVNGFIIFAHDRSIKDEWHDPNFWNVLYWIFEFETNHDWYLVASRKLQKKFTLEPNTSFSLAWWTDNEQKWSCTLLALHDICSTVHGTFMSIINATPL